jgi:hypothetical protein
MNCPVHQKPMRESEDGKTFFCPVPHGEKPDGKKIWYRVPAGAPPHNPVMQTSSPSPGVIQGSPFHASGLAWEPLPHADSRVTLACAALEFASRVYQGGGQEAQGPALALADATYSAFLKVLA